MNDSHALARLRADIHIEKLIKSNFGSKKSKANIHLITNLKRFSTDVTIEVFENNIFVSKKYKDFSATMTFDRSCNIKEIQIVSKLSTNWIIARSEQFIDPVALEMMLDLLTINSCELLPSMNLDTTVFVEHMKN